ncbi:NB-ARC domain-containing protein [Actinosynnema sp. NPDC023587]|uniref:NB-ARC domain-containing protein n=1 Tax=Actinosynnema sp. NPDC023587 TaxID=3154695 RepID=UPI00340A1A9C
MEGIDPVDARGGAEYVALLRRRREVAGLSYRQLARRAGELGDALPPSTTATMLCRTTLPTGKLVATFVRACGGDEDEITGWLAARTRLLTAGPADPVPEPPAAPGPPRQLPARPAVLVGRGRELAALDAAAGADSALLVVTGPPGVGKTTLAVAWAHRVRTRFPGGQLYLDLDGDPHAASAPAHLLVGLGVPATAVPGDVRQAAALFRSAVADRRVLVVLDNAVSADQVRLLRPAGPGSCTVVTSRDRLTSAAVHDGGQVVEVPPLDRGDAIRLVARAAGDRVVAAELTAVAALVELCDGLPLALRVAVTALDRRVESPVADLVAEMRGSGPLATLETRSDVSVAACFQRSYDGLDTVARRLFGLFGTSAPTTITAPVAAAALDLDPTRARTSLRDLALGHLVVPVGADGYTMPGLLREYSRSREPVAAPAEPGPADDAAA